MAAAHDANGNIVQREIRAAQIRKEQRDSGQQPVLQLADVQWDKINTVSGNPTVDRFRGEQLALVREKEVMLTAISSALQGNFGQVPSNDVREIWHIASREAEAALAREDDREAGIPPVLQLDNVSWGCPPDEGISTIMKFRAEQLALVEPLRPQIEAALAAWERVRNQQTQDDQLRTQLEGTTALGQGGLNNGANRRG